MSYRSAEQAVKQIMKECKKIRVPAQIEIDIEDILLKKCFDKKKGR